MPCSAAQMFTCAVALGRDVVVPRRCRAHAGVETPPADRADRRLAGRRPGPLPDAARAGRPHRRQRRARLPRRAAADQAGRVGGAHLHGRHAVPAGWCGCRSAPTCRRREADGDDRARTAARGRAARSSRGALRGGLRGAVPPDRPRRAPSPSGIATRGRRWMPATGCGSSWPAERGRRRGRRARPDAVSSGRASRYICRSDRATVLACARSTIRSRASWRAASDRASSCSLWKLSSRDASSRPSSTAVRTAQRGSARCRQSVKWQPAASASMSSKAAPAASPSRRWSTAAARACPACR